MSQYWFYLTSWVCVVLIPQARSAPLNSHAFHSMENPVLFNVHQENLLYTQDNCDKNPIILFQLGVPKTGRMHQIRVHLQWLGKCGALYMPLTFLLFSALVDEKLSPFKSCFLCNIIMKSGSDT